MFPSSGYFRGVNCPFYASGLCERPYCHYRHSRVEESKSNRTENTGYSSSRPYTPSVLQKPLYSSLPSVKSNSYGHTDIASYSTSTSEPVGPVEVYSTSGNGSQATKDVWPIPSFTEPATSLPESNEEPVAYDSLPVISGLPKPKLGSSRTPSYVPTPKSRAEPKVKTRVPSYEPTPKHSLGNVKRNPTTLEYDPEKNFAVSEKVRADHSDEENSGEEDDLMGSEGHICNGTKSVDGLLEDGEFSDDEAAEDNSGSQAGEELTFVDDDVINKHSATSSASEKLPSYAELLTPSSYFTNKLSREASEDSASSSASKALSTRKTSTESRSSSKSPGRHKDSGSISSHKSHSSKSDSTSKHHSGGSKNAGQKTHRSSSVCSSASHTSNGSRESRSSSVDVKKPSNSSSHKSHGKSKSLSSSHGKSSKDRKSSTKESSIKSSTSSHSSERGGSSTSEKENRNSSKQKPSRSVTSSSSSSKASSTSSKPNRLFNTKEGKDSSLTSHERKLSDQDIKEEKFDKDGRDGKSSHRHLSSKTSAESSTKMKVEQTGVSTGKHQPSSHNAHLSHKKEKSPSKVGKIKKEKRESVDHDKRKDKEKSRKLISERRISDLTSNLFGEESSGSGSDSDVQIVEPPPKPPAPVVELSDSESEDVGDDDMSLSYPTDDVDLLSDSDTFDECLRIFQESEQQMAAKAAKQKFDPNLSKTTEVPKVPEAAENLLVSLAKKRMAHQGASQVKRATKSPAFQRPRLSPAEVMHNRIVEMQKRALLRAAKREGRESELPSGLSGSASAQSSSQNNHQSLSPALPTGASSSLSAAAASLLSTQKKRQAHTPVLKTPSKSPSASSAGNTRSPTSFYGKSKVNGTQSATSTKTVTIAGTASKTEKRKAHEPSLLNLKRPIIPVEFGSKVPTNIRQRYLNLIIDEYLKFNQEETAFSKGLEEEKAVYTKASNKNIYLRVAVNAITRIRSEAIESQPSSSKKPRTDMSLSSIARMTSSSSHALQSHEATLGGSRAAKTSYTLHRSGVPSRIQPQIYRGQEFYERLKKYILTEEQLQANGFPRPSEDGSNKVKIYKEEEKDKMLKENERTCKRCGKRFYVDKEGSAITVEQCVYHYSHTYRRKVNGTFDSRYGCCNEGPGSKGCQVAKCHVHERNKTENLTGYMRTLPASPTSEKNLAVYSLDCEMVYTKAGLELARVTVIGDDNSVKYESLVKPDTEIIDYNTRFSGITEADMKGVTMTLRGVQAVMLSMFSDKTILMGHSLESDLQSLKLMHNTVVDTSVVFPHRLGPPYKRALRNLMVDHLQKIIQTDDGGHDSKEDAVACMQLMQYKVKQDAKREIRRV